MLADAGWTEGKDWLNEVELPGMPTKVDVGYADYVLYGDDSRPLAVIEAKRTCVGGERPSTGQALRRPAGKNIIAARSFSDQRL